MDNDDGNESVSHHQQPKTVFRVARASICCLLPASFATTNISVTFLLPLVVVSIFIMLGCCPTCEKEDELAAAAMAQQPSTNKARMTGGQNDRPSSGNDKNNGNDDDDEEGLLVLSLTDLVEHKADVWTTVTSFLDGRSE